MRGLGNQGTFLALRDLVRTHSPSFVFLSKTKVTRRRADWIWMKLGFKGCFTVDRVGSGGGLMLLWTDLVLVSIRSFSVGHIDSVVFDGSRSWRFTGFYGNPVVSERKQSWDLLYRLMGLMNMPWIVGGDFNKVLSLDDKLGGSGRRCGGMLDFQACLDGCDLQDLRWRGYQFTWCNNQMGDGRIEERLDRFCANSSWLALFDCWQVDHLYSIASHHSPIKL